MRGLIVAVLAMFFVAGDSSHWVAQLLYNARQAPFPQTLLWSAARQGSEEAQARMISLASQQGQAYWLQQLVKLDNADAAWALHKLLGDEQAGDQLMRLAARGNVPQAQMEYALATDDPQERVKWLSRAAKQHYLPAQVSLADWYLLNQQYDKARPLLKIAAQKDTQSAFQYGKLLWDEEQYKEGKHFLQKAADEGHTLASNYVSLLESYTPRRPEQTEKEAWPQGCLQRIGLFATSLSTLAKANTIYQQFSKDDRLSSLSVCLARPTWLAANTLACESRVSRLSCDVRGLAPAIDRLEATHAVIVAEEGKANVENGVMHLDLTDTYSVFVHELAHFSGFVDEYPLTSDLAERVCSGSNAPNMVYDGKLTYKPHSRVQDWMKRDPSAGVWPNKTCDMLGVATYKPSNSITFMEHHDSGVIPPVYLAMWQVQLENPDAQRPIFMNLFQAFHHAGAQQQAGKWLARYHAFLGDAPVSREVAGD